MSNTTLLTQSEFIEICDWESFQYSGSHRKPDPPWPWFRLHNNFIESQAWFAMTKPQRADFVQLLSLVSRFGNLIPRDVKWLGRHGISSKTLPSLEKLSLIRSFSLSEDDDRIKTLRSIHSGGTPYRKEEKRIEEKREEAPKNASASGVNDSNCPSPTLPDGNSRPEIDLNRAIKSTHHDSRRWDDLKLAVKPHIERFGADPDLIHRMAGQSLRMTPKQIATCVSQLVEDREVTLPVKPEASL